MDKEHYGYDQPPQYNNPPAGAVAQQPTVHAPVAEKEHYGYDQPPQYSQTPTSPTSVVVQQNQFGQPGGAVVLTQPTSQTIIVQAPIRPPNYMWLSCLVYWCCNWLFGGIAFVLSMVSASSADENRMEEAKRYGKASLYTSLAGIAISVVLIIILIILWVAVWQDEADKHEHDYY